MSSEFKVITQAFVSLNITSANNPFGVEKRYSKDVHISELKNKLEMITGYAANDIKLKLLDKDKNFICDVNENEKMLGFYPAEDGYFLHVEATQNLESTRKLWLQPHLVPNHQ